MATILPTNSAPPAQVDSVNLPDRPPDAMSINVAEVTPLDVGEVGGQVDHGHPVIGRSYISQQSVQSLGPLREWHREHG